MTGSAVSFAAVRRMSLTLVPLVVVFLTTTLSAPAGAGGRPTVVTVPSAFKAVDGKTYRITNHIVRARLDLHRSDHKWLLVWAGDESNNLPQQSSTTDPDFLAVIDAEPGPTYGKVVNTVTMDSVLGSEPHHMQYHWRKGDKVYASGLLGDITYVFDVARLPEVRLNGVTPPTATPCGSVPDAYQVLSDGTAYGSYMGGPDVTGPCTYSDGQTRVGNGYGGSPGEIVHIAPDGRVLSESPAAITANDGDACGNIPLLPQPSCANPHGIALREDLNRMVTSDFAEPRNLITGQPVLDPVIVRDTVRIFDISDRNHPKLRSVSHLPVGPRGTFWLDSENYSVMEAAATALPWHKGVFVGTMGGAVFYTPDMTVEHPVWREVYDDQQAFSTLFPVNAPGSPSDGGAWTQLSPDDRYLYRLVLTGGLGPLENIENGMLIALDVQALLAAGPGAKCNIDTMAEVAGGGAEPDCPKLASVVAVEDVTSGGPHWGAMDTYRKGFGGRYYDSSQVSRIAAANYFLAAAGPDGDHRVCVYNVGARSQISLDTTFRDERTGATCVAFNRTSWPHGNTGAARPHGVLFVVSDRHHG
jgi:hypothetical protein